MPCCWASGFCAHGRAFVYRVYFPMFVLGGNFAGSLVTFVLSWSVYFTDWPNRGLGVLLMKGLSGPVIYLASSRHSLVTRPLVILKCHLSQLSVNFPDAASWHPFLRSFLSRTLAFPVAYFCSLFWCQKVIAHRWFCCFHWTLLGPVLWRWPVCGCWPLFRVSWWLWRHCIPWVLPAFWHTWKCFVSALPHTLPL